MQTGRNRPLKKLTILRLERLRAVAILALAVLTLVGICRGQGTMSLTFEGQPLGTSSATSLYAEAGMQFSCPFGVPNLVLLGPAVSGQPDNGTGYLQLGPGVGPTLRSVSFAPFDLVSWDLAEFRPQFFEGTPGPATVYLVGHRYDIGTVTTNFTTDGAYDGTGPLQDFQTFTFGSLFMDLMSVDISTSTGVSLDNVVIGGVPEPSVGALIVLGTACAIWFRRGRRASRRG